MLGFSSNAESKGAHRSFVSGRSAMLILLAITAVLMLALPAREYLKQRSQIHSTAVTVADQTNRVASLQRQLEQWQNPDYIREQARRRLHFVLPGEVGYVVLGAGSGPSDVNNATPNDIGSKAPWYAQLWNSMRSADRDDVATNYSANPPRARADR